MKTILKSTILISTSLFLFASCSSDNDSLDTTKPEITIFTPEDHQEFELGSVINVEALLTDNTELSRYKIEIHSGEDGHNHGEGNHNHRAVTSTNSTETKFEFQEEGPISGKEFILKKSIPLPTADIEEGHYHLGIYAIDKAGNQSESFIEIVIGEDHHH